jgi:PD-(D/E)XK nuclease superfamily
MAMTAFTVDEVTQADTHSWTEVPFGGRASDRPAQALPWDPSQPVTIPDTDVLIQGRIDRLDLRSASGAVRVTDYKTGKVPRQPERLVIGGGAELQRSLYTLACRQLLPDCRHIAARLVYLSDPPRPYRLDDLDRALTQIGEFVGLACALLRGGTAVRRHRRAAPGVASLARILAAKGVELRSSRGPSFGLLGCPMSRLPDR